MPNFFLSKITPPYLLHIHTHMCPGMIGQNIMFSDTLFENRRGPYYIVYKINITEAKIYALFRTLSKYKSPPYSGLGRVNDYLWEFVLVQTQNKLCFKFKGQCHEICDIFSCCFNLSTLSPYEQAKRVSRTFSFLRRYSSENHVSG